jgi:hypothetical protein
MLLLKTKLPQSHGYWRKRFAAALAPEFRAPEYSLHIDRRSAVRCLRHLTSGCDIHEIKTWRRAFDAKRLHDCADRRCKLAPVHPPCNAERADKKKNYGSC